MAVSTETPDAILDVIDGGFWAKITLGLQGLGYLSVARRNWKLKDTPIPCFHTVLLEPPSFCDIDARFLLGTNDVPHPDPQQCLFVWARRGVNAGKGFNNGFFQRLTLVSQQDSQFQSSKGDTVTLNYPNPTIRSPKGFRSSSSSARSNAPVLREGARCRAGGLGLEHGRARQRLLCFSVKARLDDAPRANRGKRTQGPYT